MTEERAREIAATYLEARNTGELDRLDDIYSPDVVVHDCSAPDDIQGLPALKAFYAETHEGFPDFRVRWDEVLAVEDRIVFRFTIEGTHTGDLRGMPPTGRRIRLEGVAIDRIDDGHIVEEWVYFNVLSLLQQLGVAAP